MPRATSKAMRRACVRKRRYENQADARAAARALSRKFGALVHAYRCHVGRKGKPRHWHVGHMFRTKR